LLQGKVPKDHTEDMTKRTKSITLKMTEADYRLIIEAANKVWPEAVLTDSAMVLGMARRAALQVMESIRPTKK